MRFENREQAGRLLAERLAHLEDARPVVLGLTRGGVPVAFEVARRLHAPLDLIVVRKIRQATMPELAIGAMAEGGVTYVNPTFVHEAGLRNEDVAALADEALADLAGRVRLYRGAVPAPSLAGRAVIIVDDFVATGAIARAAARAARRRGATRVLLAVPAISAAVETELRGEYDQVVALEAVSAPARPSDAYVHLGEVTDAAAVEFLRDARLERLGEEAAPAAAP